MPDAVLAVLREDLGLGPFVSVVAARLLAVLVDPALYDMNRRDLGQCARMGLGLMSGLDRGQAKAFSTTRARFGEADALFAQLCAGITEAVRVRDTDDVVGRLQSHGLLPFVAQTLEHLLCEFRKMLAPEGRERDASRTPDAEYVELWQAAHPAYERFIRSI